MTVRQMTAKTLNAIKGWPNPAALDFHAEIDASVVTNLAGAPALAGSVVRLNPAGNYQLGVGTAPVMPLFMFANSDDPDINADGGDLATDRDAWAPISPTGQAMALPATGPYELASTQFVDAAYAPNDALTSPSDDDDPTNVDNGKLEVGVLYTDMIVGIVSRGVVDNGYGRDALAFWPFPVFPIPSA